MTYKIGTIYKIICKLDSSVIYIGSTFTKLRKRWHNHKFEYKNKKGTISIHKYFDKFGIDNFKIIDIKSYLCYQEHTRDYKHLHAYETLWINKTKNCCNMLLPFSPTRYYKETAKFYYQQNKESILKKHKDYKEKNKESITKDNKIYREKNKEIIKQKAKQIIICDCGDQISKCCLSKHIKRKKHQTYLKNKY